MLISTIQVFPETEYSSRLRLWETLGSLYSFRFQSAGQLNNGSSSALLVFCATYREALDLAENHPMVIAYIKPETSSRGGSVDVGFAENPSVPAYIQGKSFTLPNSPSCSSTDRCKGNDSSVLGTVNGRPFWHLVTRGACNLHIVDLELAPLNEDDFLFNWFQDSRCIALVPLLSLLRRLSGWTPPPLRACVMFDDPNIRWKSYGYVDFQKLQADAITHNYHVSFATVPLDLWSLHAKTAALFRQSDSRLSLLIHGNNHTYFELARSYSELSRQNLARQSIARIERFERTSGLQICRVMAAPHGACNPEMATELLHSGFEAACISRSSLMGRNPTIPWPSTVGLAPAEFLGDGLPVVPRFGISWNPTGFLLLGCLFGQPFIPVGHHDNLRNGLDILRALAETINRCGAVRWGDLTSISRSNYWTRSLGAILEVRLYSSRITLTIPEGITHLRLLTLTGLQTTVEIAESGSASDPGICHENEMPVHAGQKLIIRSGCPVKPEAFGVRFERAPARAVLRRTLCETRDRLRPYLDKFAIHRQSQGTKK